MAIKSVLATKQYGYEDMLSELVVNACLTTLPPNSKNPKLNLDSVRIAKLRGGNLNLSSVVKGMVFLRDAEGLVKKAENAKVIVFGCGLEASATEAKGTVLLKNADELLNYNKSEERKMEELIEGIAATGCCCCCYYCYYNNNYIIIDITGVKIVICNGAISEMAMHFLDKFNLMVLLLLLFL